MKCFSIFSKYLLVLRQIFCIHYSSRRKLVTTKKLWPEAKKYLKILSLLLIYCLIWTFAILVHIIFISSSSNFSHWDQWLIQNKIWRKKNKNHWKVNNSNCLYDKFISAKLTRSLNKNCEQMITKYSTM